MFLCAKRRRFLLGRELSFEDVLYQSATVVKDLPDTKFPDIDLTDGISDEDFLDQFPVDPTQVTSVIKHRARAMQQKRFRIDPKKTKRIIKFLQIHAAVSRFCSIDPLMRFSRAAIILHFRAIEPSKVSVFPLLLCRSCVASNSQTTFTKPHYRSLPRSRNTS
jgi:hypothetical protein